MIIKTKDIYHLALRLLGLAFTEFFGVTESTRFTPNENRIAFWVDGRNAVDALARVVAQAGARNVEGPMVYETGYYALFFEDPFGNRFEICHRTQNAQRL